MSQRFLLNNNYKREQTLESKRIVFMLLLDVMLLDIMLKQAVYTLYMPMSHVYRNTFIYKFVT